MRKKSLTNESSSSTIHFSSMWYANTWQNQQFREPLEAHGPQAHTSFIPNIHSFTSPRIFRCLFFQIELDARLGSSIKALRERYCRWWDQTPRRQQPQHKFDMFSERIRWQLGGRLGQCTRPINTRLNIRQRVSHSYGFPLFEAQIGRVTDTDQASICWILLILLSYQHGYSVILTVPRLS